MELYIFRHGEKEKNDLFIGHTDVQLTKKGKSQSEKITKEFERLNIEKIFTSDLQRTFIKNGVQQKELREICFGEWESLSWTEIEKHYPQEAKNYIHDPLNFCFPSGESYKQFQKRVLRWVKKLKKQQWSRVGIVTHQGVIRAIVSNFLGKNFWSIKIKPGQKIKLEL